MNYYPYTGNPSTDKIGVPGMYGTSVEAMAAYQQQQASMQAAAQQTGMPPSAQHYTTLGMSQNYPAASIYASSLGSNPYGSVAAMSPAAANAYAQQRPAGTSPTGHPGYTTNPYAMQGMSAAAYSQMVPATTSYPGSYSVGSGSMLGYPAHAQIRSPSGYQTVGGYPAGLANPSMPTYNPATGVPHPGLVRTAPGYPGTSPYSRLP